MKLIRNAKELVKTTYLETIENIENDNKELKKEFDNFQKEAPKLNVNTIKDFELKFKRINKKVEYANEILSNETILNDQYAEVNKKLDAKLKSISIKNLNSSKYEYSLNTLGITWKLNPELHDKDPVNVPDSHILVLAKGGSSYKSFVSNETFDGPVTCSLLITKIDPNNLTGNWMYCFGLVKEEQHEKQNDYYLHAATLGANGVYNAKFTPSPESDKYPVKWAEGDTVTMERTAENDIYYSVNNTERRKIFSGVEGPMRIIMAVDGKCNGDIFEVVEASY